MLKLLRSTKNFNYFFFVPVVEWSNGERERERKEKCWTRTKVYGWKLIWCINEYVENLFLVWCTSLHHSRCTTTTLKSNRMNAGKSEQPNRENWTMKRNIACTSHCICPLEFQWHKHTYIHKRASSEITYSFSFFYSCFVCIVCRSFNIVSSWQRIYLFDVYINLMLIKTACNERRSVNQKSLKNWVREWEKAFAFVVMNDNN